MTRQAFVGLFGVYGLRSIVQWSSKGCEIECHSERAIHTGMDYCG